MRRAHIVLVGVASVFAACQMFDTFVTLRNDGAELVMITAPREADEGLSAVAAGEAKEIRIRDLRGSATFVAKTPAGRHLGSAICQPGTGPGNRGVVWDGRTLRCTGWTGTSETAAAAAPTPTAAATRTPAPAATATASPAARTSAPAASAPPPTATAARTVTPTQAPTVAPTVAPTRVPTPAPTLNPVRTVTLVNSGSQNTHLFGPGETFPCCMVPPGSSRTRSFNSATTPSVQFEAGRNGSRVAGPITCTFASGAAPRVTYTGSALRCDAW